MSSFWEIFGTSSVGQIVYTACKKIASVMIEGLKCLCFNAGILIPKYISIAWESFRECKALSSLALKTSHPSDGRSSVIFTSVVIPDYCSHNDLFIDLEVASTALRAAWRDVHTTN